MTDEALSAAKNADAVFLGAVGGPVSLAFVSERSTHDTQGMPSRILC